MLEVYLALLTSLAGLYIASIFNSTDGRKNTISQSLQLHADKTLLVLIALMVVYTILSILQIVNLAQYISGSSKFVPKTYFSLVLAGYAAIILYLFLKIVFSLHKNSIKFLTPQFNQTNIILVMGLAVIWMYLNTLNQQFSVIANHIAISLNGLFIISAVMSIYIIYLLSKYYSMLVKGMILEHMDFYSHFLKLTLAITLFSFAMLSRETQGCEMVICNTLIAGHAIIMNHTISELGRSIKRTLGMR
ncbi:hypothetical protein [Geoglobus acetivorans]|uniref:Uncharacterized protein n=1 Tax=Geoglobus acetivorans TaxID=565033 RepID=A0ABZ3H2G4_GEOAI|nr:hypothetical protein [Geoglobus acetivorans]